VQKQISIEGDQSEFAFYRVAVSSFLKNLLAIFFRKIRKIPFYVDAIFQLL